MFALFLTAFLACSSETKETTTTDNKTTTTTEATNGKTDVTTPVITPTTPVVNKTSDKKTTESTTGNTLETQTPEVKEFVEKSVNTSETEQMFLLIFLFACTEDHFRIDSGILTIEACISIAPEGDCIKKKKQ